MASKVCLHFIRGDCDLGDRCKFLHVGGQAIPPTPKTGICYDFQRGKCSRGDNCKFLHDGGQAITPTPKTGICYDFQRGKCSRGDSCKFLHEGGQEESPVNATPAPAPAPKNGICKAFQKGKCNRGDSCKFQHEEESTATPSPAPKNGICKAFQKGKCNRGDSCKFLHEGGQEESPVNATPTPAPAPKNGICKAFQKGKCNRGDSCKFQHRLEDENILLDDKPSSPKILSSLAKSSSTQAEDDNDSSNDDDCVTLTISYTSDRLLTSVGVNILQLQKLCEDHSVEIFADTKDPVVAVSPEGLQQMKSQFVLDEIGLLQIAMTTNPYVDDDVKRRILLGLLQGRGLNIILEDGFIIAPTPNLGIPIAFDGEVSFIQRIQKNMRRAPPDLSSFCTWKQHTSGVPIHHLVNFILSKLSQLPPESSLLRHFRLKSYSSIMNKLFYRGKNLSDLLATTVTSQQGYLNLKTLLEEKGGVLDSSEEDHTNGNDCVFYRYVRFLQVTIANRPAFIVPVYYEIVLQNFQTPRAHEIYAFDRLRFGLNDGQVNTLFIAGVNTESL